MKTRTWAYGSTLRGKVIENHGGLQMIVDQNGEAHLLTIGAADPEAQVGNHGTMTFTAGGPAGGYWKFERDKVRCDHKFIDSKSCVKCGWTP